MGDTNFPNLDNVNVFKHENNYDYLKYDFTQMTITACRVPWDMGEIHRGNRTIEGLGNVVYFETKEERDKWFAEIPANEKYVWESKYRDLHANGEITIPLPYDIACTFNYICVEYGIIPNSKTPLMYESEIGLRKWFWFIREIEQGGSPNGCILHVIIDAWQTFIYDFHVGNMLLERGHAPAFAIDVEDYLANPLENNEYLLANDVNYSESKRVAHSDYIPIGAGEKCVCFALPMSLNGIMNAGGEAWEGRATGPTFANGPERDGANYVINDYEWNYGSADLSNAHLPLMPYYANDIPNGVILYAINTADSSTFFDMLHAYKPHVMTAIEGVFIVPKEDLSFGDSREVFGVTVTRVLPADTTIDISLTKEQFGYGAKYDDLAKLYTFPYSELEITDNEGNSNIIRIENCGELKAEKRLLAAFPYLQWKLAVTGYAGSGSIRYEWHKANGQAPQLEIPNSEWAELLFTFDIPVYELRMTAQQAELASVYEDMVIAREKAVNDYHATMRSVNTNYENTLDANDTTVGNTNRENATNVSNTQRSTSADVSNAAADASTAITNTATATATATNITNKRNNILDRTSGINDTKLMKDAEVASTLTISTASAENDLAAISFTNSATADAINTTTGAVGATLSGSLSGLPTMVGFGAQLQASKSNLIASIANNSEVARLAGQANNKYYYNASDNMSRVNSCVKEENSDVTSYNNTCASTQVALSASTLNANANRTKTATDSNASATAATSNDNANYTRATSNSNANYTRGAATATAQDALRFAQTRETGTFKGRELAKPERIGRSIGTGLEDCYKRRGIQIKVRTQPDAAIRQTGDFFLRFGYAFNGVWSFDGNWNIGKKFTYWKCADIWTSSLSIPDAYADMLRFFLLGGVTVWRKPEYIGNTTIYDNGL